MPRHADMLKTPEEQKRPVKRSKDNRKTEREERETEEEGDDETGISGKVIFNRTASTNFQFARHSGMMEG